MTFESQLSLYWADLIERFITQDEGGWKFTDHANDPGGMTYGGMTYNTFNLGMEKYHEKVSAEGFRAAASAPDGSATNTQLRLRVKQVYFNLFIEPFGEGDTHGLPGADMLISCAVNVGFKPCVQIMQRTINSLGSVQDKLKVDGVCGAMTRAKWKFAYQILGLSGLRQAFVKQWVKYYIDMVQDNTKSWVNYVRYLEFRLDSSNEGKEWDGPIKCPKYNRAEYLEGWVNRANRYA
jgi:lysozyme family protein